MHLIAIALRVLAYNSTSPLRSTHRCEVSSRDARRRRSAPSSRPASVSGATSLARRCVVQSTRSTRAREISRAACALRAVTPAQVVIEAPNRLVLVCVNDHYLARAAGSRVSGRDGRARSCSRSRHREQGELVPEHGAAASEAERAPSVAQPALHVRRAFVVGRSNQLRARAARARRDCSPGDHYNPLFICRRRSASGRRTS